MLIALDEYFDRVNLRQEDQYTLKEKSTLPNPQKSSADLKTTGDVLKVRKNE